jgi:hypothetical protein
VVFTTGLAEGFTLSEVEKMYQAVKQKQWFSMDWKAIF